MPHRRARWHLQAPGPRAAVFAAGAATLLLTSAGPVALAEPPALEVTNPTVVVCVQPLGDHDPKLLAASERGITYLYGYAVRRLPARPLPKAAWYAPRHRWRAEVLLDDLAATKPEGCTYILGFTHRDISTTKAPYHDWGILGLGEVGGVAGVVSTWRVSRKLSPPHTRARRTVKVVNHELGHVLGLPHVKGEGCLMNDAEGTVLSVDRESGLLCDSTVAYIERTHGHRIPRHETFEWRKVE